MTATTIDPTTVLTDRYVPRRAGGERIAHLLTSTWPATSGGYRPAVCGARARTWQSARLLADPAAPEDCRPCLERAGRVQPAAPTRPIAPPAVRTTRPERIGERAGRQLTAAERCLRRVEFARSLGRFEETYDRRR